MDTIKKYIKKEMSFESLYSSLDSNSCYHEPKDIFKIKQNISVCFGCSSIIYTNESGKKILPIKPQKYNVSQETSTPIFLSICDTHCTYRFCNKEDYLQIRANIVKKMKIFSQKMNLSMTTFFLALDYFDRLCSKLTTFNFSVNQIAQFCVLLAAKFQDGQQNAITAKCCLGYSKNYSKDELYILQLLNYELYSITSYDILKDIMHIGFLFNNEKFSRNKMNIIYGKMEKMLYFFSETKYYIEMTKMEIALAVIGFVRETLGLTAYNNILKDIFMNGGDEKKYLNCLSKFRKYFKIQDDSRHNCNKENNNCTKNINENNNCNSRSDSFDSTSSSENSSENISENIGTENDNTCRNS
jgi:hypothetical protein